MYRTLVVLRIRDNFECVFGSSIGEQVLTDVRGSYM